MFKLTKTYLNSLFANFWRLGKQKKQKSTNKGGVFKTCTTKINIYFVYK